MQRTGLRPGATGAAKIQSWERQRRWWTARPAADAIVRLVVGVEETAAVGEGKRRPPAGRAELSQPRLALDRGRA